METYGKDVLLSIDGGWEEARKLLDDFRKPGISARPREGSPDIYEVSFDESVLEPGIIKISGNTLRFSSGKEEDPGQLARVYAGEFARNLALNGIGFAVSYMHEMPGKKTDTPESNPLW